MSTRAAGPPAGATGIRGHPSSAPPYGLPLRYPARRHGVPRCRAPEVLPATPGRLPALPAAPGRLPAAPGRLPAPRGAIASAGSPLVATRLRTWAGSLGPKLREWRRRYLLAEVTGTLCALVAAVAVEAGTGSAASAALAASLAETAGFYAVIFRQTIPPLYRVHAGLGPVRRLCRTCRHGAAEASDFAVAELADTLLLRPGLIYLASTWAGVG